MRFRLVSLFVFVITPLAHAVQLVTIDQLEKILSGDRHMSDGRVANQLAGLTITERVTAERLAAWQAQFPGIRTQQMLLLLADESAFYPLPVSEISSAPAPSAADERKIFNAAREYARHLVHNLPNLLADRQTLYFETSLDAVQQQARDADLASDYVRADLPLSFTGQFSAPVTYRDGKEVFTDHVPTASNSGLTTQGEFGPALTIVLGDAEHSSVAWSYWQRHGGSRVAVFRYRVPAEGSHYLVEYHDRRVRQMCPAYHGEIAVDPGTGSILRISIVSDPATSSEPASGILVEYGSAVLGGRDYIVPLHGVAITRIPIRLGYRPLAAAATPVQTYLNDVVFTRYRLFRADAHILSGEESQRLRDDVPTMPALTASPQ